VDHDHGISSDHLFKAMTNFLLNDCWPNRRHVIASAAALHPASSVVMATLIGVLASAMLGYSKLLNSVSSALDLCLV